jgi:hypothetical protein
MGGNPSKDLAAGLTRWEVSIKPDSVRDIPDLDAPAPENRTEIIFSPPGDVGENFPLILPKDVFDGNFPLGLAEGDNFIGGTNFWVGDSMMRMSSADLHIVKSAVDGGISGIYGVAGGLAIEALDFVLDSLGSFWFTKGSVINQELAAAGRTVLPLLDGSEVGEADRTYIVILANLSAIANPLAVMKYTSGESAVLVIDPKDPMIYFAKYDAFGKIVERVKKLSGDTKEGSKAGKPAAGTGDEAGTGKAKGGLEFSFKAAGLSFHGLLPVKRKVTWPFNSDRDGIVFTDDWGQLLSVDQIRARNPGKTISDDYSPTDTISYIRSEGDQRTVVFYYGDEELATRAQGDLDNDEIPIISLSNLYLDGSVNIFKATGIPVTIAGEFGITYWSREDLASAEPTPTDPPGSGSDVFVNVQDEAYTRILANGTVTLSVEKLDAIPFINQPELGAASVLLSIGPSRSYGYFSIESDSKKQLTELVDFSSLGKAAPYFEKYLPEYISAGQGEFRMALFFDKASGSDLRAMLRVHSDYVFNPGYFLNHVVSLAAGKEMKIVQDQITFEGDLVAGTDGLFLSGLSKNGLAFGLDGGIRIGPQVGSRIGAWVIDENEWGLHFDGSAGFALPGIGDLVMSSGLLQVNDSRIVVEGLMNFGIPGVATLGGSVAGIFRYDPAWVNLKGDLSMELLGFLALEAQAEIDSRTGIRLAGHINHDILGSVDVAGSLSPLDGRFMLTGEAAILPVGSINLADLTVSLSNDGVFASGALNIPEVSTIQVSGEIRADGFAFTGSGDISIAGFDLANAAVSFTDAGIAMEGRLNIPGFVSTRVAGSMNYTTGEVSLSGTGNVTIGSGPNAVTLVAATVTLQGNLSTGTVSVYVKANFEFYDIASLGVEGYGSLAVGPPPSFAASVEGNFYLGASIGRNFTVAGYDLVFRISASLDVAVTISTDGNPYVGASATVTGSLTHPWVTVTFKKSCVDMGLFDACVYYPDFSWSNYTHNISGSASASVSQSGVHVNVSIPSPLNAVFGSSVGFDIP